LKFLRVNIRKISIMIALSLTFTRRMKEIFLEIYGTQKLIVSDKK
jgi:hypothetical protein